MQYFRHGKEDEISDTDWLPEYISVQKHTPAIATMFLFLLFYVNIYVSIARHNYQI